MVSPSLEHVDRGGIRTARWQRSDWSDVRDWGGEQRPGASDHADVPPQGRADASLRGRVVDAPKCVSFGARSVPAARRPATRWSTPPGRSRAPVELVGAVAGRGRNRRSRDAIRGLPCPFLVVLTRRAPIALLARSADRESGTTLQKHLPTYRPHGRVPYRLLECQIESTATSHSRSTDTWEGS